MTQRHQRLTTTNVACGVGAVILALICGVSFGPAGLRWPGVVSNLLAHVHVPGIRSTLTARQNTILWQIRIPRVVLAGLVGSVLSLAGGAYQGVFRNSLADPYLLGIAAGAGLGATTVIVYGEHWGSTSTLVPLAAFGGALVAVVIAYSVASLADARRLNSGTLLLSGIATASFLTAIQTFVQQTRADTLRRVYGWILGRLNSVGWHDVLVILPYCMVAIVVILLHGRLLDVLAVGDDHAEHLGVNAARVRLIVVAAASLGTAAAVAVSGLIGFVGLVVPHIIRLLVGSSYRVLLPLCLFGGAAFLILSDLAARTAVSPGELPIGVVTAFVGAPFFAFILRTTRRTS